jgi:hypothetical protein
VITVRDTKFFKTRLVPIGPKLTRELAAHMERRRLLPLPAGEASPLFTTRAALPPKTALHTVLSEMAAGGMSVGSAPTRRLAGLMLQPEPGRR